MVRLSASTMLILCLVRRRVTLPPLLTLERARTRLWEDVAELSVCKLLMAGVGEARECATGTALCGVALLNREGVAP